MVVVALIGASGWLFGRRQYLAAASEKEANASKTGADQRKIEIEANDAAREQLIKIVRQFREESERVNTERLQERADCKAEMATLGKKMDETIAAHESERAASVIREAELLELAQKSRDRGHAIANSLNAISLQMQLDAKIQTERQASLERQLNILWQVVEKNGKPSSKDPVLTGVEKALSEQ